LEDDSKGLFGFTMTLDCVVVQATLRLKEEAPRKISDRSDVFFAPALGRLGRIEINCSSEDDRFPASLRKYHIISGKFEHIGLY